MTAFESKLPADNDYLLEPARASPADPAARRRRRRLLGGGRRPEAARRRYGKGHWNYGLFERAAARRRDPPPTTTPPPPSTPGTPRVGGPAPDSLPPRTDGGGTAHLLPRRPTTPAFTPACALGYDGKSLRKPSLEWLLNGKAKIANALGRRQPAAGPGREEGSRPPAGHPAAGVPRLRRRGGQPRPGPPPGRAGGAWPSLRGRA